MLPVMWCKFFHQQTKSGLLQKLPAYSTVIKFLNPMTEEVPSWETSELFLEVHKSWKLLSVYVNKRQNQTCMLYI